MFLKLKSHQEKKLFRQQNFCVCFNYNYQSNFFEILSEMSFEEFLPFFFAFEKKNWIFLQNFISKRIRKLCSLHYDLPDNYYNFVFSISLPVQNR